MEPARPGYFQAATTPFSSEEPMTYVVTRLCRDCVDTACVAVCPVSCIYRYEGDDKKTFPNQLYIRGLHDFIPCVTSAQRLSPLNNISNHRAHVTYHISYIIYHITDDIS